MEIFPQSTKCINDYPDRTNEFIGPKHFVITRVHCNYKFYEIFIFFLHVSQAEIMSMIIPNNFIFYHKKLIDKCIFYFLHSIK